jgi:hypothetical protein
VLRRLRDEGRLSDTRAGEALPPLQTADGRLVELELAERPPLQSVGSRA